MSEFGYHTIGSVTNANGGEFILVSKETLSAAGALQKLTAYMAGGASGAVALGGVIYADSAGAPGALLGTGTDIGGIAAGTPAAWVDLPFPSNIALTPAVYWIGYRFNAVSFTRYADTVASNLRYKTGLYALGAPNPFGTPAGSTNERLSLYGTYIATPVNTVAPVASGTPTQGQTLSVTDGTWTGDPTIVYTYQWERDVAGNLVYGPIGGATANTYLLVVADVGCNVRCVVTATNAAGAVAANSNKLGPVASPPTPGGPTVRRSRLVLGTGRTIVLRGR